MAAVSEEEEFEFRRRRDASLRKKQVRKGAMGEVLGATANLYKSIPFMDEGAAALDSGLRLATGQADSVPEAWRQSRELQDENAEDFKRRRPTTTAVIKGAGTGASILVPAGGQANLFAQGGRAANAARGALTASGNAYLYAAADQGTMEQRAKAGGRAARDPVTLALGAGAGALATPRRARTPKPVNPDVELLAREGVQLTPGQMRGGIAKAAEDAGTSQPVLGQAITERREEGIDSFGRAVINRALKKVDDALPEGLTGTDAVRYAGDKISAGYKTALPSRIVRADAGFAEDARAAFANVGTMTPKGQRQLNDILNQRVTSRLPQNGVMDGDLYKLIQSDLDYEVSRFSSSTDADQRAIGQAIEGVQEALEKAARRQDPAFAKKIDALDSAWAELARIETAAGKSNDLSGRFTPAQYAQSVRAGDKRVRSRGVARGEALSQDLAGAAVRVLPSKIGESGTAPRAAWGMVTSVPGAVVGGMAGGGLGAAAGIGATAGALTLGARAYSPQAVQAANAALAARIGSQESRQAMVELARMASRDPSAQALYREVLARLSGAAGAQGGARQTMQPNPFAQP